MRPPTCFLIALLFLPSLVSAQVDLRRDQAAAPNDQRSANDIEAKREFLQRLFARQLTDPQQIHATLSRLQQATPQEIDTLMAAYEKKVRDSQQQRLEKAKQELARAKAYQQYVQNRMQQQRGNPGFAPVITTLPTGTHFPVSAVVSPDRRYVRVTTSPFFSSVGPVRTFNFKNGQSGFVPGFGPQQQANPAALRPLYHDGLRTRISPAPVRVQP